MAPNLVILGSRSPRRLELLKLLVPDDRIVVKPPHSPEEAGFAGIHDPAAIEQRLTEIVRVKREDVNRQLTEDEQTRGIGIVADTIIVASGADSSLTVLGNPPEPDWRPTVRTWFADCYAGRVHEAWTGVCLWTRDRELAMDIVKTAVMFRPMTRDEIDWYVSTEESRGKAGGYALQGLASVFISRVEGSLSNVVGLPLEVVRRWIPAP